MKTIRLWFSLVLLVGLTILFANLKPPEMRVTHVEAIQAVQKPEPPHSTDSTPAPTAEPAAQPEEPPSAPEPEQPAPQPEPAQPVDSHEELMQAAGISQADWPAAEKLIMRESSWKAGNTNPSSGACGLAQELPCGKSGCGLYDSVCQLRWANTYVDSRYGGWSQALGFHYRNNWY